MRPVLHSTRRFIPIIPHVGSFRLQVAKDGSIAAVGSEVVAAEISRSGTPVLAANVKMDEITELGASTIATVALHEEVEMQVKVEVIKSKITISYG